MNATDKPIRKRAPGAGRKPRAGKAAPRRKPAPPPIIFARNLVEAWWFRIAYPTAQIHDASAIVAWRRRTGGEK